MDILPGVGQRDEKLVLTETDDFAAMRKLATESGLEEGTFEKIVVAYGYYRGDVLVGCSALKFDRGIFSVECLAVSEQLRHKGLGSKLVARIEHDAKQRGARQLWALARAPGFFEKIGFVISHEQNEDAPSTKGCSVCPQFGVSCFPAVVVKQL